MRRNSLVSTLALFGALSSVASALPAANAKLAAVDSAGVFYVSSKAGPYAAFSPKIRTVRRAANGIIEYSREYAYGTGRDNYPVQLRLDGSGNLFVCGNSVAGDDKGALFLLKYSPTGQLLWSRTYGGTLDAGRAYGLALDSAGDAYVVGSYRTSSASTSPFVGKVLKYTSAGTLSVDRTVQTQYSTSLAAIQIDASNRIYVSGTVGTTGGMPKTSSLILRYDTAVSQQWSGVSSFPTAEGSATGLAIDGSANPIASYNVRGLNPNDPSFSGAFIVKSSSVNGTPMWTKALASTLDANSAEGGLIVDASNDVVVGGTETHVSADRFSVASIYRITRIDGWTGALEFHSSFSPPGNYCSVSSVAQDAGGGYLLAGTDSQNSNNGYQMRVPAFLPSGASNGAYYFWPVNRTLGVSIITGGRSGQLYAGGYVEIDWSRSPYQAYVNNGNLGYSWYAEFATP